MSGLCADCKHWDKEKPSGILAFPPARREGWGFCLLTELDDDSTSKAMALDGEEYHAVLHTAPDFGCNQFEEKP